MFYMDCWRVNGILVVFRVIGEEAREGGYGFFSLGFLIFRGYGFV